MATISENLQILKDSTDAIKQAIIDKGGTINGDITTWASAISGISGGGSSSDEEYVFTGTLSYSMTTVTITGNLNKIPDTGRNFLSALGKNPGGLISDICNTINIGPYSLTVDFKEPISGNEIPAICILNIVGDTYVVVPVKFIQQTPIKFYVNDIEYDALYPMTWEQFVNSEIYNPTLTDTRGYEYNMFFIKDGIVCSWIMYEGECDMETEVYVKGKVEKSTDIIKENTRYLAN